MIEAKNSNPATSGGGAALNISLGNRQKPAVKNGMDEEAKVGGESQVAATTADVKTGVVENIVPKIIKKENNKDGTNATAKNSKPGLVKGLSFNPINIISLNANAAKKEGEDTDNKGDKEDKKGETGLLSGRENDAFGSVDGKENIESKGGSHANKKKVRRFLKASEETIKQLRLANAGPQYLDGPEEIVRLGWQEFKSGTIDWNTDDSWDIFYDKVAYWASDDMIAYDLIHLCETFPEYQLSIKALCNWDKIIFPAKLEPKKIEMPSAPEIVPFVQVPREIDPLYYSRRKEDRETWRGMSVESIVIKKLGLTYKDVEKAFLQPHGRHADFKAWIKKSIIEYDWTDLDDPIPDIYDINVQYVGKVPYIEAYSFQQAFAEAGRLGLIKNGDQAFYWVHKISGKKEKFFYNFSSSSAFKNYLFVKDMLSVKNNLFSSAWFNKTMFDELLAAAGERGRKHYDAALKKVALSDKMLSNETVKLISMAQEAFLASERERLKGFESIGKANQPNGLLSYAFIYWLYDYRGKKAQEIERNRAQNAKTKKQDDDRLALYGEKINSQYYRYVRDGRELEVNYKDMYLLKWYIKEKDPDGAMDVCIKGNASRKEWQDLFYMLDWYERKYLLKAFANCFYLTEEEEVAVNMILKNTPPFDKETFLKPELCKTSLYQSLKALCNNTDTRKEFYFITEEIIGSADMEEVKKLGYGNGATIEEMSKKQIASISPPTYRRRLIDALNDMDNDSPEVVNLIMYASPSQQKEVTKVLMENDMFYFILLRATLNKTQYAQLSFDEQILDPVTKKVEVRGVGLNTMFENDETYLKQVKSWLSSYGMYDNLDNNELKLATIPRSVIAKLDSHDQLKMIFFIAWGFEEVLRDEETILRVLQVVKATKSKEEKQDFYNRAKNIGLDDLKGGIDEGDNYNEVELLLNDFNSNTEAVQSRKEDITKAGYFGKDVAIAQLPESEMAALPLWKRKAYINELIGSHDNEQDFATYTDITDEASLIRLINTTPDYQILDLQKWMTADGNLWQRTRYDALEKAIHGNKFKEFHDKLKTLSERELIYQAKQNPQKLKDYYKKRQDLELLGKNHEDGWAYSNPGVLSYLAGTPSYIYTVYIENNRVYVIWRKELTVSVRRKDYDPWQLIVVEHDSDDEQLGVKKGDKTVIPAIGLMYLQNKQDVQTMFEVLDVVLLATGISELKAATTIAQRFMALTNIMLAGGNMIMRSFSKYLPKDVQELWMLLNEIFIAYSLVTISEAIITNGRKLISDLRKKLSKLNSTPELDIIKDDLINKEQLLNDAERIKGMPLDELKKFRNSIKKLNGEISPHLTKGLDELIEAKTNAQSGSNFRNALDEEALASKAEGKAKVNEELAAEERMRKEENLQEESLEGKQEKTEVDKVKDITFEEGSLNNLGDVFKVGNKIGDVEIVQVRIGNDKIVVIGRQMKDHVYKVAEVLGYEGRYVEVLDDLYLQPLYESKFEFIIEGESWTVNSAWKDMTTNPVWNKYKDANGYIKAEYLPLTPMYKLNKLWIEKAQIEGCTIIDIGYPPHDLPQSAFYEMEKTTVKWD